FAGVHAGNVNFYGGDEHDYFSYPIYHELRDRNTVLSGILANAEAQAGVRWNNQPELVAAEQISGNYFDLLGVRPAIGRLIIPADDAAQNGSPVVALSFNYWKARFNSDPGVVGKTLMVNGQPFTIVGVVQPGFRSVISGYAPQVFFPIMTTPLVNPGMVADFNDLRSAWLTVVGRLKPGVSRTAAEGGINPLWQSLRKEQLSHVDDAERLVRHGFLRDAKLLLLDNSRGFSPLRDQIRIPLLIVMGMVGLVLVMACVNVSSLLLVRAAGRVREMSVRYSLGASRWQIVRQLLTEGLLLGVLGGGLALALAPLVSSTLVRRIAGDSTVELPFSAQPDHRILLFNFGLALLAGVLFSLAPAFHFLRPDLVGALKQQTGTTSSGPLRFRRVLVGMQIGLSLLLLIGAGLFVQTLRNLKNVDVGFSTDHLVSFGIDPQLAGYKTEQAGALHQRILRTLAALPGARSVGATSDPELMGMESRTSVTLPGSSADPIIVEGPWITPGYFSTTGIPLLAGRDFTDQDLPGKPSVVIVNASFARRHFGSPQNAIGKLLAHANRQGKMNFEIVGVVGDSRHVDMRTEVKETLYRAANQLPDIGFLQFYLRTWQSPESAEADIRAAMQQLDSKLVVDGLRTMDEQVAESMTNERLIALLAVSFGVLATLMAAIGLYGVLAYATAQRTHEIGIRMALGARRETVIRLVLSDVVWLAGISIVVTVPIAMLLSRLMRSQLYNVSPADPIVIAGGVLLVSLVVGLAALLPARRAASVEPMQALRTE
ncbi:MAG: ABC transporter permease, partial [Candidatus Korobacteraceae bacterium]